MENNLMKKIGEIQKQLKAPKSQKTKQYSYRSCEDILESVKPLLNSTQTCLFLNDEVILVGERFYIKATATIVDQENGESYSTIAYAREDEKSQFMAISQLTGSASSYARKYALNGLFAIDDNKDADDIVKYQEQDAKSNYQNQYNNLVQEKKGKTYTPNKMSIESAQDLAKIFDTDSQWAIAQCNKHGWDYKKARSFSQEQADQLINDYYDYKDSKRNWDSI